jgi:hypothetical protein
MPRVGFALLLVALMASPAFAQVNVTGDWNVTIESPQGTNTVKMTLTQDGEKVTGLFKSEMGELPFNGTLTGVDLKVAFALPVQGQSLEVTMTGKVDGEAIGGKVQFGGFGEGDWSAKRAPAATAAAPAAAPPATTASTTTAAAAAPVAGGVSGEWDLTFKTPNGDIAATAKVTEDAGKLNGTLVSQLGETQFTGTLEGKSVKVSLNFETPQGTLPVIMTGDIEGDAIPNGKAEITGMGTMEWSAKKKR